MRGGGPPGAASVASKGGVIGLTKAVAADYLKLGIRCNAVCPLTGDATSARQGIGQSAIRGIEGEMTVDPCLWRRSDSLGTVDDVAGLCAFLASDDASSVTERSLYVHAGVEA